MRSGNRSAVGLGVVLALMLGCDASSGEVDAGSEPVERTPISCELGVLEGGAFTPAGKTVKAELTLGFQGFLWFDVVVRSEDGIPAIFKTKLSVTVQDTAPFNMAQPVQFGTDSPPVSSGVHVFVTGQDPKLLAGKTAHIAMVLENKTHECTVEGDVMLVDDDNCVHTNDEPCEGTDVIFDE